ncbi:ATP-binding protein [Nonomuraea sp. NPDC050536]|uniref:ATP-binding protein n=1 Tax=Nonomuraea sp. NPDC050536 TaxID=3364366 RepID=UPI0037CAE47F
MLTLTGVGGVGKTRLALRLAEDVSRAFPGGAWLVDLASLQDQELLDSTVMSALGLGEKAVHSPLIQLSEYLADKRLLIILDNCEHMVNSCAILAKRLLEAAPQLQILATGRQPLGIEGESLFTVPPLLLPELDAPAMVSSSEAVQLFVERATAISPDFTLTEQNSETVAGICRRLDGIPLGIELAAVQVRALPVQEILERLDQRFRLLAKGDGTALPRHQTLRAAIAWSYDLCSAHEKTLWARMSVFSGTCDLEAIEHVCSGGGIAMEEVLDLVAALVDKSIIFRQDHGSRARYRLLETVREFGADSLASSGEQAEMRARHWDYYRRLVQGGEVDWFGPDQVEWTLRLYTERSNLRVALEYSLTEPGEEHAGLEVAATLHILWMITGALREGCRWLKRALALNPEPTRARAKALWGHAYLLIVLGDIEAALSMLQECRTLGEQLNDPLARAYANLWTGSAKMYSGDFSSALPLLEEALARHRNIGDLFGIYLALRHLSMASTLTGDPRAAAFEEECLTLCEAYSADFSTSWALWTAGFGEWWRGDSERGVARIRASLRLKVLIDDMVGEAYCVEVLAWAAVTTKDLKRAARLFGAAHVIWSRVGSTLLGFGAFQRFHDPLEEQVRRELGDAYPKLFAEGEKLQMDDVISYALGEKAPYPAVAAADEDKPVLTAREREVAELIGLGLSNKEIASRLVIAQRTAEGHVEHILTKLGFSSRSQIAVWVAKH